MIATRNIAETAPDWAVSDASASVLASMSAIGARATYTQLGGVSEETLAQAHFGSQEEQRITADALAARIAQLEQERDRWVQLCARQSSGSSQTVDLSGVSEHDTTSDQSFISEVVSLCTSPGEVSQTSTSYGLADPFPLTVIPLASQTHYYEPMDPFISKWYGLGLCGDIRLLCVWPATATGGWTLNIGGNLGMTGLPQMQASVDRLQLLPLATQTPSLSSVSTFVSQPGLFDHVVADLHRWTERVKMRLKYKTWLGTVRKTITVAIERMEYLASNPTVTEAYGVADFIKLDRGLYIRFSPYFDVDPTLYPWRACVLSLTRSCDSLELPYTSWLGSCLSIKALPELGSLATRATSRLTVTDRAYPSRTVTFSASALEYQSNVGTQATVIGDGPLQGDIVQPVGSFAAVCACEREAIRSEGRLLWPADEEAVWQSA